MAHLNRFCGLAVPFPLEGKMDYWFAVAVILGTLAFSFVPLRVAWLMTDGLSNKNRFGVIYFTFCGLGLIEAWFRFFTPVLRPMLGFE